MKFALYSATFTPQLPDMSVFRVGGRKWYPI
jgi:hypothetical protein